MRRAGFTLVEVLLAIFIAGTTIAMLVLAAGRCLKIASKAEQMELVRGLFSELDRTAPLQLEDVEDGYSDNGDFPDQRGFAWRRTCTLLGEEEDGMFEIHTRIEWNNGNGYEETFTLLHLPTALRAGYIDENATNAR